MHGPHSSGSSSVVFYSARASLLSAVRQRRAAVFPPHRCDGGGPAAGRPQSSLCSSDGLTNHTPPLGRSGLPSVLCWRLLGACGRTGLGNATLREQRRFASAGRRPTYSEIGEALAVLGFGKLDYSDKELKQKYRELVKKNHPDAGGDEKAMARIAVAYERLSGLTRREREEFTRQQLAFSGRARAGSYANPYQDHRYAHQRGAGGAGPFRQQPPSGYGNQYYQQDAYPGQAGSQSSSYWNYYHRMQQEAARAAGDGGAARGFAENPFTSRNPFSFRTQAQRARFMSPTSLFVQGLVLYLLLSTLFLFAYRALRDYLNEDGWKMSESLARHEQMQELHRLRQEMREKADLYREMQQQQQQHGGSNPGHAFFYDNRVPNELRNAHVGETAEQRALEYARQRRLQIIEEQRRIGNTANVGGAGAGGKELHSNLINSENSITHLPELKGWPLISEQEGRIIKRAQDPPGIVFFEPRKADARARQIFNRMRGNEKDAVAVPATPPPQHKSQSEGPSGRDDINDRPIGVPVLSAAARAEASGLPPQTPPGQAESNVGSVFAAQINNNADAKAAMSTIFGALREARARSSS